MSETTAPDGDISISVPVSAMSSAPAHPKTTWQRRLNAIVTYGTAASTVIALAGCAGRAWWVFALAANFRVQSFWGLLLATILLLATHRRKTAIFTAALMALHGWLLWPYLATPPRSWHHEDAALQTVRLRVVTLNLWASNTQYQRVVEFLRKSSADIVVLEEIDPVWVPHLEPLQVDWPHHSSLTWEGRYGMAIFSRWPIARPHNEFLSDGVPVITARTLVNDVPLAIFGVHLSHPLSRAGYRQQAQELVALPKILKDKSLDRIVLGDFNSTPWNPAFFDFLSQAGLSESRLGFGVQPSWPSSLPVALRIPIDHCLVSKNVRVVRHKIGPPVGSDHLPVIVDLEVRRPIPENDSPAK